MSRLFLVLGALAGGLAVALGAFSAHSITVSPERLDTFQVGVQYQMVHALALVVVSWASASWPGKYVHAAGYFFVAGIILFSGSLYVLVLTDTPWLGAVSAAGGTAFIVGWALLAWGVYRYR